ncbi:hypothetical protein NLI96_g4347 [Meripilus lineatus]|uniref:DUF6534 domain-containing protein n=1 Tax=Meripilus lineatus TaxID=2056292 RepID=A0AAD5YI48_9APHY|nr:hypothetical protein NLI96_g4347 [Physisporinus lineatus]
MLPRSCLGNSLKPHFDRQAPSVHLISIQTPCDHPSDSDRSNLPRSLYCILGSMASAPSPESVLGGYFVAIIFAILLYGISIAQAYVFWLNSGRDHKYLRAIVWIVMSVSIKLDSSANAQRSAPNRFFETLHSGFTIHMAYHYAISSFGNLAAVEHIIWSSGACVCSGVSGFSGVVYFYFLLTVMTQLLVISVVQIFYLRRIWIRTAALTYRLHTWPRFREDAGPMATLSSGVALSTLMDLLIASILIFFLSRSRTGFEETDHLIQKLMVYAVNTGALTTICQLAVVFVFVFQKDSLLFAGLWLMTSKLYANSLLGTLNARHVLRKQHEDLRPSELRFMPSHSHSHSHSQSQSRPIEIFQETSKVTDIDVSA